MVPITLQEAYDLPLSFQVGRIREVLDQLSLLQILPHGLILYLDYALIIKSAYQIFIRWLVWVIEKSEDGRGSWLGGRSDFNGRDQSLTLSSLY